MSEHPILFGGPMVRAILAGQKTQTRRVIKDDWWRCLDPEEPEDRAKALLQCPYGIPGDRLWVKEALRRCTESNFVMYDAGRINALYYGVAPAKPMVWHWKKDYLPSMFMPRWASRLTLEVAGVRVERLHDISEDDAIAEGVDAIPVGVVRRQATWNRRQDFAQLWDIINAQRGFSWASNPWVWVVEFKKI